MNSKIQSMPRGWFGAAALAIGILIGGCSGGSNSSTPSLPQTAGMLPGQMVYGANGQSERFLGTLTPSRTVPQVTGTRVHDILPSYRRTALHPNVSGDLAYHGGHTLFHSGEIFVYVNPSANPVPSQWGWMGGFIGRYSTSTLNSYLNYFTGATSNNREPYLGYFSVPTYTPIDGGVIMNDDDTFNILRAVIAADGGKTGYGFTYHIFYPQGQAQCQGNPTKGYQNCYPAQYCAYHGRTNFSGGLPSGEIIYSIQPWQQVAGCKAPTDTVQNDQASSLSVAESEMVTDGDMNGWFRDVDGAENGDLCGSTYGHIIMNPNAIDYNIPMEYSNIKHACSFGPT